MNEQKATEILMALDCIGEDDSLCGSRCTYAAWQKEDGISNIVLDGDYTAEHLEAIVWWVRNKS